MRAWHASGTHSTQSNIIKASYGLQKAYYHAQRSLSASTSDVPAPLHNSTPSPCLPLSASSIMPSNSSVHPPATVYSGTRGAKRKQAGSSSRAIASSEAASAKESQLHTIAVHNTGTFIIVLEVSAHAQWLRWCGGCTWTLATLSRQCQGCSHCISRYRDPAHPLPSSMLHEERTLSFFVGFRLEAGPEQLCI